MQHSSEIWKNKKAVVYDGFSEQAVLQAKGGFMDEILLFAHNTDSSSISIMEVEKLVKKWFDPVPPQQRYHK